MNSPPSPPLPASEPHGLPWVPLAALDQLWFQVGGTVCNYTCAHCFISCSPHNHAFGMLPRSAVQSRLEESLAWGVNEYYFTGGEPFLNPELTDILCDALDYGPVTVLTNASVLKDAWLVRLRAAAEASLYSLEFRVSLDGYSPETNDPIRGLGTFARTLRGAGQLAQHGFLPIITAARTWPLADEPAVIARFGAALQRAGCRRPRLKILPTLQLGAEAKRTRGYAAAERVTAEMLEGYDLDQLVCRRARIVTDRGVQVCPILIEAPESRLGNSLAAAQRPFAITHGACSTCYQYGAICGNASTSARPAEALR